MPAGAPFGNQNWRGRTKDCSRPIKYDNPEELWAKACEYFQWIDDNPLYSIEFLGKDAERREIPKMRAYTKGGLFLFMCVNHNYFDEARERLEKIESGTEKYEHARNMLFIIEKIEWTIKIQKFEGAAAGLLNPVIISRDLGLADKSDVKTDGRQVITVKYADGNNSAPATSRPTGGIR